MQSSERRLISKSGLSFMDRAKRLSGWTGGRTFSTLAGRVLLRSFQTWAWTLAWQSTASTLALSLLQSLKCIKQPCMYSLSILVLMRFSQPSSQTSCLLTNLYSSQTTFFSSSSSSSVMFSIYGTHLGAGPSWGMKKQPILGSSSAAKIMPLFFTTVHMLMPFSGYTLVKSWPSALVILSCFLLLKRMCLSLLWRKWMELRGSLQEERRVSSLRSKRTSKRESVLPQPMAMSRPVGSHLTWLMAVEDCSLQTRQRWRKSHTSSSSPPQNSTLSLSLKYILLIKLSVCSGDMNLPSYREILQTQLAEALIQRLELTGLKRRSLGQWGIRVLQWAPYWAWIQMLRSTWAMAILLQSSVRMVNLTTQLLRPRRHFRLSQAVSNIFICGPQMPEAMMQRWSLEISTWLVVTQNWKSWISSILRLNSSLYLRDLLVLFASSTKCWQVLPADMLQVLMPLISVILYINNFWVFIYFFIQQSTLLIYFHLEKFRIYNFLLLYQLYLPIQTNNLTNMQNSAFYCNKSLISTIPNQVTIEQYYPVTFQQKDLKVVDLKLQVRSHRLILSSQAAHAFVINCEKIESVDVSESGIFWAKEYAIKLHTAYGKVKLHLKNHNEAKITIQAVLAKRQWTITQPADKKDELYSGMFKKLQKEKQKISTQEQTVVSSFTNFETLFGNLRELKQIMGSMKMSTGQADGENPQVNKILKEIGFVAVVSKDETGSGFVRHLAGDLYGICTSTLFKTFGGMVPLLDLFYFYNKKRQMELVSPGELLEACGLFERLGYKARLVSYPNNIKMVEETSFDPEKDFDAHFRQYFEDFRVGYSAQEIARKKGVPLSIIQIKLKNAANKGKLAIDDRIEGVKYYRNYFLQI